MSKPWYLRKPQIREWYKRVAYTPFYSALGAAESFEDVKEHPDLVNFLTSYERKWANDEILPGWGRGVFSCLFYCWYPVPTSPIEEQHCRGNF